MAKNEKNTVGFVLQFLGGLIFLAVVAQLWSVAGVVSPPSGWVGGLFGAPFIATVLYAGSVLGAISLLFVSFSQLGKAPRYAGWRAIKTASMVGFALAVLTVSNVALLATTVLGFLVGTAGAVTALMKIDRRGR